MNTCREYHIPTRPFTPIDALNRRAAAVGSPRYAMAASGADYNGHNLNVTFNDYRGYWITQYYWAGREVLARGDFQDCLNAALSYHDRGALGSSVAVLVPEDKPEIVVLCDAHERLVKGREEKLPWVTWMHTSAAQCARDVACPGMRPMIFDWDLMQQCSGADDYYNRLREKHGRVFA